MSASEKLLLAQSKDLRERDAAQQALVALARTVITMAVELDRRRTR